MYPIVHTLCGDVQGIRLESGNLAFRGISYAHAGRWEYPVPVTEWEGLYDATAFGPISMQGAAFTPKKEGEPSFYEKEFRLNLPYTYSEDSLSLNIYTPEHAKNLPVIIYIHGGAYMGGSGWDHVFEEPAWPERGIVAVTINYRLGIFGNIVLPELEEEAGHAGNYNVYDQLAAVEWVYRNIAAFGGDPENITLMGQSAGARSVQMLVGSPRLKGIVKKAIMSSGGGCPSQLFETVPTMEEAREFWMDWQSMLGGPSLKELRQMAAEKLVSSIGMMFGKYGFHRAILFVSPIYDLRDFPEPGSSTDLEDGCLEIPYLCGGNSEDIVPGLPQDAKRWTALRPVPSYSYAFCRQLPGDENGAWHSADLWYWFGALKRCWRPFMPSDESLKDVMLTAMRNFVTQGDPNGEGVPVWLPSQETDQTMILDETCGMGQMPEQKTGLML